VADADHGNITVSGTGTVWTIDNGVVTYAKMQAASASSRVVGSSSTSTTLTELTLEHGPEPQRDHPDRHGWGDGWGRRRHNGGRAPAVRGSALITKLGYLRRRSRTSPPLDKALGPGPPPAPAASRRSLAPQPAGRVTGRCGRLGLPLGRPGPRRPRRPETQHILRRLSGTNYGRPDDHSHRRS
jgi:hypothetical protein